ncbi:MAG: hypothetical protein CM1200mP39_12050 [Dehalococcoidia bacterium]|nr:MAG: hypothetical protein CM1200mP39_12050 [Dehalococcoidia bacterium]
MLDAVRGASVVDSEAGGITQSIGAYQVIKGDQQLTFMIRPVTLHLRKCAQMEHVFTDIAFPCGCS